MRKKILAHDIFSVYTDFRKRKLFTKSMLRPAKAHFSERIVKEGKDFYREWDPKRSKLAATIINGCPNAGIREDSWVLYLGASHGYTPSFVSDMIGPKGTLFAIEFAPEVLRDLVFISEERNNIVPILGDANHPETYADKVSQVDVVFQDVAQKNQVEIFIKNCELFLKEGGVGLLAIKARSISIKRKSQEIFQEIRHTLENKYVVTDFRDLGPHEKDHCMIIIKKKTPIEGMNQVKKNFDSKSRKNLRSEKKSIYNKFKRNN
jgi:fibrillarin-like pre-rRNA processing protein